MSPANEKDIVGAKLKQPHEAADKQAAAPSPSPQQQPPPAVSTSNTRPEPASHAQQPAPAIPKEFYVSEADSDGEGVKDIPELEEIPQPQPQRAAPVAAPASSMAPGADAQQMRMPPGMDPQQVQSMMQDPAAMRQAAEMVKTLDPAQLQSMAQMAGAPGGHHTLLSFRPRVSLLTKSADTRTTLASVLLWKLNWQRVPYNVLCLCLLLSGLTSCSTCVRWQLVILFAHVTEAATEVMLANGSDTDTAVTGCAGWLQLACRCHLK